MVSRCFLVGVGVTNYKGRTEFDWGHLEIQLHHESEKRDEMEPKRRERREEEK